MTNDEEYAKRLLAVKDTCAKSRDFVSGRNKFMEVLSLVTNNGESAEEIVNLIGKIVSQARRNLGGESGFESDEVKMMNLEVLITIFSKGYHHMFTALSVLIHRSCMWHTRANGR